MHVIALAMVLSVTCLVATGVLLLVGLLLVGRDGHTGPSLQYAAVAGIAEVSASAMYLVWVNVGGAPTFAAANTLMVLGPAMIPIAFRALGPTTVNRACVLVSATGVAAVAVASLLLPVDAAVLVRVWAFAVVGACGAVAAACSSEGHRRPIRAIAAALGVFALYYAARGVALIVMGPGGAARTVILSEAGAIVVGVVSVFVITGATSTFWLAVRRETLLAAAQTSAELVVVPDRRAGDTRRLPRFHELVRDVREAATTIDDGAVAVFGGAGLSRSGAAPSLKDILRSDHGWTEDEIALLRQTVVGR